MVHSYLVEIPLLETSKVEVERAMRTLRAAESRLGGTPDAPCVVATGMATDEGRLLCLVEAGGPQPVLTLVALALLPAPRIRVLTPVLPPAKPGNASASRSVGRRDPGRDLRSRVESELVEDVPDVGLDGPFGEE